MTTTQQALRALLAVPVEALGEGRTAERWRCLYQWARSGSVSVARLAEAHLDATAILAEAGIAPTRGAIYGVWASAGPDDTAVFRSASSTIEGVKPFASGIGIVDRSLIEAKDEHGRRWLLDVDVADLSLNGSWATPALSDTATGNAVLGTRSASPIGEPGFYLHRAGFWYGAVGPAACWAGAASGIVDWATESLSEDPHLQSTQGALLAQRDLLEAVLAMSGDFIDRAAQRAGEAQAHAYSVRHLIERSCATIVDRFSEGFGPRPFVSNPEIAQRVLDLSLYCRQQHGERDLAALAKSAL